MNLPIEQIYPQVDKALAHQGQCVIVAPPGAGKSTLLPLHLLSSVEGLILLVEPRRVAARAVARRMADLLGQEVGQTVGYAMRMERKQSHQTRILVVTEGVFTHRVLDDPELGGVGGVLFDEFHERSLDADFGLALALDVRGALRPDLKLIVMSATLDGARVAELMGNAPKIEAQGRQFDVDIRYRPPKPDEKLEQAMAATIKQMLLQEEGNILAFLPGQREIERTAALLEHLPKSVKRFSDKRCSKNNKLEHFIDYPSETKNALASIDMPNTIIAPLYGRLSAQAQDDAIQMPEEGYRKVVLATSIAQTSLTIEGVRIVIDSGLTRLPVSEPGCGLTRLKTVRAAQADIAQRMGRAGRLGPGIAIRLWHEGQMRARPEFSPPEILNADLSSLWLDCAAFGLRHPKELSFLDPPPRAACDEARQLLIRLGALGEDGRLSKKGHMMRQLRLPVRYAHMVACVPCLKAVELALMLSECLPGYAEIDIETRFENFCRDSRPPVRKIKQLARQMMDKIPEEMRQDVPSVAALLLHAWPDRVARARGQYGQFLLSNGRAAQMDVTHPLAKEPWLVVADIVGEKNNARILAAVATGEETIRHNLEFQIETAIVTEFNPQSGTIRSVEKTKLGAIDLSARPLPVPDGEAVVQAWARALCQYGTNILPWDKNSLALRQRLNWLHQTLGAPWPEMTEEALRTQLADFLPRHADLKDADDFLGSALLALIPYERQRQLDVLAPKYFTAPTGTKVALDYAAERPILRIRVQELFGLNQHPSLAGGKVPLVLELLSPAMHPLQVTSDLPAFWRGSWCEVRTQMRGRYPKHVWPEDPSTALPTRRAKPRKA